MIDPGPPVRLAIPFAGHRRRKGQIVSPSQTMVRPTYAPAHTPAGAVDYCNCAPASAQTTTVHTAGLADTDAGHRGSATPDRPLRCRQPRKSTPPNARRRQTDGPAPLAIPERGCGASIHSADDAPRGHGASKCLPVNSSTKVTGTAPGRSAATVRRSGGGRSSPVVAGGVTEMRHSLSCQDSSISGCSDPATRCMRGLLELLNARVQRRRTR